MEDFGRRPLEGHHQADLERAPYQKGMLLLYHPAGITHSARYLDHTIDSIGQQEARLKALGIQPKVSLEIEFATYRETIGPQADHWKQIKEKALASVAPGSDDAEKIRAFGPREVMMYDLINLDPRTKDILELLPPDGYFDAGDMMELKLKPVAPTQMKKNLELLSEVLYRKVTQEYGLVFAPNTNANFHVNLSFWDKNGNLFDPDHPEFSTQGKRMAEGMLRAMFDSFALHLDNGQLTRKTDAFCDLSVGRGGSLRSARGRVEIRPTEEDMNSDPLLLTAIGLAGAEHALRHGQSSLREAAKDPERTVPVEIVEKLSVKEPPRASLMVMRHVLNGSVLQRNRALSLPEKYIRDKTRDLAQELLGVESKMAREARGLLRAFGQDKPAYQEGLMDFFRKIRVKKTGNSCEVVWPMTEPGIYRFTDADKVQRTIDVAALSSTLGAIGTHTAFSTRVTISVWRFLALRMCLSRAGKECGRAPPSGCSPPSFERA